MCQAELAEVCLGRGNGIISGVLWERKPKKIREWDIRLHTPRARSVVVFSSSCELEFENGIEADWIVKFR